MKKIDIHHENLANDKVKAKKVWKKPELLELNLKNTNSNNPGTISDAQIGSGTAS